MRNKIKSKNAESSKILETLKKADQFYQMY